MADLPPVPLQGLPVLEFDYLIKAAVLYIGRNVILHCAVGKGAGAVGVGEHEGPVEAHLVHKAHGEGVVFLGFRAESGNNIRCEAAVRHNLTDL